MTNRRYKIIFMGTPDFAVPGLKALASDSRFEILTVVTQEDKPVGRKQELTFPAIKKAALDLELPVLQPKKLKEIVTDLQNLEPDFIVVIAYGQILSTKVLSIPKVTCVNVHASLLPKYRGSACLQAPILNGDDQAGITVMLMEKSLDTGDILKQAAIDLKGDESLEYIHDTLSNLGAKILGDTLVDLAEGKIIPQKQDDSQSSYVKEIDKSDGEINWSKGALEIERQIRAYNPWPSAFSHLEDKLLKIFKAQIIENNDNNLEIGQIFEQNGALAIKCGQNALLILELQLEGKKAMDAKSFLAGNKQVIGKILQMVSSSNG
ncbi:MAG: methionyl-tRNA formyltransferase [Patescibacteria group bacterium]